MPSIDQSALGLLETRGLVAALEAADAMVKTANVRILRREKTSPAFITIQIVGDVAAVKTAVEAGRLAAERVGEVLSVHVIARPAADLVRLLDDRSREVKNGDRAPRPDLDGMTVRELRALARDIPTLPIQGRAIARARKEELVTLLRDHRHE